MDDALSRGLSYLTNVQNADGGWGYRPEGVSYVEPTAAVLMAHSLSGANAPDSAWDWLRVAQRSDGAWGIDRGGSAPSWMSAWGVWACSLHGQDAGAAGRGASWLLHVPVLRIADAETSLAMRQLLDLDAALTGWPWQAGEAAWVLPTALSMLALAAAGYVQEAQVSEGARYLLDRRCVDGGWNFGNPVMLGKALPATAQETCLALMALKTAGVGEDHPAVVAGLRSLGTGTTLITGNADATWQLLGLKAWGKDRPRLWETLVAGQSETGSWSGSPFSTAAAVLALAPASLMTRWQP